MLGKPPGNELSCIDRVATVGLREVHCCIRAVYSAQTLQPTRSLPETPCEIQRVDSSPIESEGSHLNIYLLGHKSPPMHYVPVFLRPLSQMNTGLESRIEDRVEEVDTIVSQSERVHFDQKEEVPVWRYEEALQGKTVIEHGRKVRVEHEVDYPKRHWWIITDGILANLDPSLRDHADIFDLILAVNLCIDEPVAFSQSPGQTIGGVYRTRKNALDYRGDLNWGSFPLALLTMNEIPSKVRVSGGIEEVYKMVRTFRSTTIESDEDMDIRIGLHMYDDALTASLWTAMTNFYFVCENVLCSGRSSNAVSRIAETTEMDSEEADNWRKAVNRLKHPDKGDVPGLHDQPGLKVPRLGYMRKTANTALVQTMEHRFRETEGEP